MVGPSNLSDDTNKSPPFQLTFARLQRINEMRCMDPEGFNHHPESWSIAEWTNAMAGEAGEACNFAKKLIRHRDAIAGNKGDDLDRGLLEQKLAKECGDTIIYALLTLSRINRNADEVMREVFNGTSNKIGWNGPRI